MEKEQVNQMMTEANELINNTAREIEGKLEDLCDDISKKYMRYLTAKEFNEYLELMNKKELIEAVETILGTIRRIKYIK